MEALVAHLQMRQGTTVAVLVLAIVTAGAFFFFAFSCRALPVWCPPLPLAAVLVSLRGYGRQRSEISRSVRLRRFYGRGVERLEENWTGDGNSGEEFEARGHILGIFQPALTPIRSI
jgi:hypothetical protein